MTRDAAADHKPSIVGGVYLRTSPSQVNTADRCLRAWWYDKRAKLPRKPPSKGQMIGTKAHKEIEHYLLTGEDVRGYLPRAGAHLLAPYDHRAPFRGGDLLVEASLEAPALFTPGGVEFVGYSDLIVPDLDEPETIDHKFKKSIEQYGTTEAELRTDVQVITYGEWLRRRFPTARTVRVSHHSHQTQGRIYAERVSVALPVDHVATEFAKIAARIDGPMREAARLDRAEDVPHTTDESACRAYGGCDFAAVCPASPRNKIALSWFPTEIESMGLLDSMKNTPAPATTPAPIVAPAPVQAAPAAPVAASLPAGAIVAAQGEAEHLYTLADGRRVKLEAVAGNAVFCSDVHGAPVRVAATDALVPSPAPVDGDARFSPGWTPPPPPPKPEPVQVLPPDAPVSKAANTDAAPVAEKAKRTRKAKAEKNDEAGEETDGGRTGLVLYVDCVPVGVEVRDLNREIVGWADKLADGAKIADVRMAPKDSVLAYGGWRGALAGAARAEITEAGAYLVRSGELADPVIEALVAVADLVIRPLAVR